MNSRKASVTRKLIAIHRRKVSRISSIRVEKCTSISLKYNTRCTRCWRVERLTKFKRPRISWLINAALIDRPTETAARSWSILSTRTASVGEYKAQYGSIDFVALELLSIVITKFANISRTHQRLVTIDFRPLYSQNFRIRRIKKIWWIEIIKVLVTINTRQNSNECSYQNDKSCTCDMIKLNIFGEEILDNCCSIFTFKKFVLTRRQF